MNKGFTLVELIAVIVILALVVVITTPAYDSISKNIKERNYTSKQSTIKSETLAFVEKYLKDEVYNGYYKDDFDNEVNDKGKRLCFTVDYLIRNGIISSDSETDEYILNNVTGEEHKTNQTPPKIYLQIFYDYEDLKLQAFTLDEKSIETSLKKDTELERAFIFKNDGTPKCDKTY